MRLKPFDSTLWAKAPQNTPLRELRRAVVDSGDKIFIDFEGDTYSYAEVDRISTRMANSFASLGLKPGETVTTILDSGIDAVACWFGANKIGVIWVPVNTAYRHEFLRHQAADSGARIVVCEGHYLTSVLEVAGGLPHLELVLVTGNAPLPRDATVRIDYLDNHRGHDETLPAHEAKPADIACLIYTSGTTGPSKGCMISYNYLCQNGLQHNEGMPPQPGEVMWTPLPMFHISTTGYGIVGAMLARTTISIARQFSVTGFWSEIERSGATLATLMASIFPLLAQAPDNEAMKRCFGQLRIVTGVPVTPEIRAIWKERFGVNYLNSYGYGQTEASKIAHHYYGDPTPPEYSAGMPADDFDVMIADESGHPCPPDTPGEIWVRPRKPNIMMSGYWRRPEATAAVWHDLWMHTGDMAKIDAQGYFYFVDRKKDYVRSRGENISSFEVERTFMQHPAVSEVAFHSVRAEAGAEEHLKVTVVLKSGESLAEEALVRWSIDHLPHFAVPRYVEYVPELPKTPTGRIQKYRLRDAGVTDQSWDAHAIGLIARRPARV
jgi:crotonobetaine/carnitine-CoA ligase